MKTLAVLVVFVLLLPAGATASAAGSAGLAGRPSRTGATAGPAPSAPEPTTTTTTARSAEAAAASHPGTTLPGPTRALPGRAASAEQDVSAPTASDQPVSARSASVETASTSTTTAATRGSAPAVQPSGLAVRNGQLVLDGRPYRDVGLNVYELATDWGVNNGCGAMLSDAQMNSFFASLPAHTLVRFWAWQATMAVNVKTGQIDWAPLDRVFDAAAAHHDLLLVSLTSQGGDCDDNHWKDPAWYDGGYRETYGPNTNGTVSPLSYWQYVQEIVTRYRNSPALGMWEPVNEPEASSCPPGYSGVACSGHQTCPDETAAAQALRNFFDTVGGEIHSLDPGGLVEAGFLGAGPCGTAGHDYQYVGASPGIDVLTYHDYYPPDDAVGGDQWNGIAVRESQAKALDKPLIAGEVGLTGGDPADTQDCLSLSTRQSDFAVRIAQQSALGTEVFLFWNWVPPPADNCSGDITTGDPSLSLLGQFTPGQP